MGTQDYVQGRKVRRVENRETQSRSYRYTKTMSFIMYDKLADTGG